MSKSKQTMISMRRASCAARDEAAQAYGDYQRQVSAAAGDLKPAEPWSLFNPAVRDAHFKAPRQLADLAK